MHILTYILSLNGGAGKSAIQYQNTLSGVKRNQVSIIIGHGDANLMSRLDERVDQHMLCVRRSLLAVPGLTRAMRTVLPDVVFAIGVANVLPLTLAMKLSRHQCPMVLREANSPAGLFESYGRVKQIVKKIAMRDAYRRADRIVCLTKGMKHELIVDWNVPAAKLTHIPNGVVMSAPKVMPRDHASPATILCVARLAPQKDIPTLLTAFALLRARRVCRLQIAGDGTERASLEALAIELGIALDVTFLGHVSDPTPLFLGAHVSVLSSVYEGFPHVLIESLAQGCPVVATDCPTGPSEVIDSDAVGYLARMRDPQDLAAKLEQALDREFDPVALRKRAEFFSEARLHERIRAFFDSYTAAQVGASIR